MFDYCDIVYGGLNQTDSMTLQKLQNFSLKSMLKVPKRTSTAEIHSQVKLPLLYTRRNFHCMNEMYKVYHGLAPISIRNMFMKVPEVHRCQTRQVSRD